MAENKCNTLKNQLDHMKEVYGLKKQGRTRKFSSIASKKQSGKHQTVHFFNIHSNLLYNVSDGNMTMSSVSCTSTDGKQLLRKQNPHSIETDNTGAAVRTINNILNGITESVNRLSELHVQVGETPGREKIPGGKSDRANPGHLFYASSPKPVSKCIVLGIECDFDGKWQIFSFPYPF